MPLIKIASFVLFLSLSALAAGPAPAAPSSAVPPLTDLKAWDFSVRMDIRYATPNNFLKAPVYPEPKCFLRKPVVEALSRVETALKLQGVGLQVFDCYRPLSIQKKMWALVPDPRYVADPKEGSKHNRGAAVDVTLVDNLGVPLEMTSGYDDFTPRAHRDYRGGTAKARRNRERLEKAMAKEGFVGLPTEWWHFDYTGWEKFPVEDVPFSALK